MQSAEESASSHAPPDGATFCRCLLGPVDFASEKN
jgi:hypothetical protein